jgi:hypothetical protein
MNFQKRSFRVGAYRSGFFFTQRRYILSNTTPNRTTKADLHRQDLSKYKLFLGACCHLFVYGSFFMDFSAKSCFFLPPDFDAFFLFGGVE